MTFSISNVEPGLVRLAIEGQLDRVTVVSLRGELEQLMGAKPRRVEIDLSLLEMIDSAGVGSIVSLYKSVRAHGGEVVVMGLRGQPLSIFKLLRLEVMTVPR